MNYCPKCKPKRLMYILPDGTWRCYLCGYVKIIKVED